MNKKHLRKVAIVCLLALGAGTYYAQAASNTVPSSSLGSGTGAISGYTVSGISYTHNATNPQNVDQISFTIAPTTAAYVKAQLVTGGSWYNCTNTAGAVTCATTSPQATSLAPDNLTVIGSN